MEIFQLLPVNLDSPTIHEQDLQSAPDVMSSVHSAPAHIHSPAPFQGELFLPQGTLYKPASFILDIPTIRQIFSDVLTITIPFVGEMIFRAGVTPERRSFHWLVDRKLASRSPASREIEIPLHDLRDGKLELEIYALDDTLLFANPPEASVLEFQPENILYKFLVPTLNLCSEQPLYFKFSDANSWFSFESGNIHMRQGSTVNFLSYFNAYSVGNWRRHTNARNVWLYLELEGSAYADLSLQTETGTISVSLWGSQSNMKKIIAIPIPEAIDDGVVGAMLYALGDCVVYGGGYVCFDTDTQDVRLGIGITSFKREDATKKSVARLSAQIAGDPYYHDKISLAVVDNGRTLEADDVSHATLIPNRNLGGTGGFMRSLLHYEEIGGYTHCLFMDDDAACEAGSIFRSLSFLRHANDKRLAIGGAMLSAEVRYLQWENCAWFDDRCYPFKNGYDLRDAKKLVENEKEIKDKSVYAGWWFFMFPLAGVKQYSFPFFLHGDDIQFSYLNDFIICSLNGVCAWQGNFKSKESPQTIYFDIRSYVLHHLAVPWLGKKLPQTIKMVAKFFNDFNDSGQYDVARSIVEAFNDIQTGTWYWLENMDTSAIRNRIAANIKYQKQQPVSQLLGGELHEEYLEQNKLRKLVRILSLNGHLVPRFLLKDEILNISALIMPHRERIFLRKKFNIYNPLTNQRWILERDSGYYFANKVKFYLAAFKFMLRYKSLRKKYAKFYSTLSSNEFWKMEFNK